MWLILGTSLLIPSKRKEELKAIITIEEEINLRVLTSLISSTLQLTLTNKEKM
jgi:hypothetical protein